eukprot:scaffold17139_cov132-Skeletonema_marinoi.AAC.8
MQFTTLQSPQKQEQQQQQRQHEEELPQAVAAETKSAPVDNNQEDDEEEAITTFWNLHDEVERLKEAQDIQVRDGVQTNMEDQDDGDGEAEEQYDIHYGENTGSNLGIFILPSDEDHSSSVSVDELRGDEEKTPSSPYHIFHGKQSEENTATGNYGSYGGGGSSSSSPPKGSGGSSGSSGGAGSSSNNSGSISPEESQLRDVLTNVKELGSNVNTAIHQKTSSEKNGVNDPLRAPSNFDFYNPGGGGPLPGTGTSNGGETIAPPRGNDGPTSQPTFFGKRNCKATNGSFGDNRQERSGGGVTLKFRYELNTDATPGGPYQRASLYNEILPALEDSMTTMMLPAFFSDECMKISGSVSRRKVIRGRFLRGGGGGNEDQVQLFEGLDLLEEDPTTLGYQHQHRRLNRVIGIDSDPMDFPLNGERCFGGYSPPNPAIVPKCYVMEGSMTVYFPESFDFKNLVTGAQLTALNTIKEGMEFGTIAEMAHPAILDLTFLESSYSLRPIIPGENVPQAVAPETKDAGGGGGNVGLIVGIICVLVVFVIIAGCFFRYRLKQEQAKLDAMMRNGTSKKEKKKKKKKKKGSDIDDEDDDDSDRSSDGTPSDPTSLYILNRYANEMGDADDEDNLTDREKEIHQRLKKRRKVKKKMRRASYASNLSSNHDGSFSTLDTDSDLMGYYASMGASGTTGSKTTTSSDSTTENSGTSGSESSTTSHSQTFHTTSTGTSEQTTSDSGTTSSGGTTSDSDDDSEEEDAFDMNDEHFNVGAAGTNTFSNGAMKGQRRKKKGPKSNLIMTGDDDDVSVGTEATGATEAISNVNRGGNRGGGYGGGFSGGASAATEVMGNAGKTNPYGSSEWGGGGDFSGGASAAPSVDFSAATEAMGNVGRNRNNGASEFGGGGGFSGGASAAPSVDFSAATEAMGNVGRGRNNGASEWGGGGFSGGASAAPSVDFSAATEAMGNVGRGRNNLGGGGGGGGFSGGASAAVSVDFSAATEAMGNVGRGKKKSGGGFSGGGSAGPGASVAMSAATEAIKNTGRGRKPQQMESIGELTFSDF